MRVVSFRYAISCLSRVSLAAISVLAPHAAFAQARVADPAAPANPTTNYFPGGVAPPPPGTPIGGGNTTGSSSRPTSGDKEDSFDLGTNSGGAGSVYGNPNGHAYLDGNSAGGGDTLRLSGGSMPDPYVVRKGDTLWGICDTYFHNPYQWPRVWSFNPQLQNPHWIYPGDFIRLSQASGSQAAQPITAQGDGGGSLVDRRRQVAPQTVFLRDVGFIDDDQKDDWGTISGASVDKMFLTDTDEVYVRIAPGHDVRIGQELTIFRPIRNAGTGKLVQIQGTVRVDQWDPSTHIARGVISETLDVVERGARIGPVGRRFNVVAPVRNDKDLVANVLASVYPHTFYGQNQIVFIDKGSVEGLKPGNRLFVVRRGDAWHKSLASDVAGNRISLESDSPAAIERVPSPPSDAKLPEEVMGELRVLTTREHSAACLVTQSRSEIELGDDAVARKGY